MIDISKLLEISDKYAGDPEGFSSLFSSIMPEHIPSRSAKYVTNTQSSIVPPTIKPKTSVDLAPKSDLLTNFGKYGSLLSLVGAGASALNNGDKPKAGLSALSGAMQGASTGMALGPWGAAAGAVVGGVTSFLSADKQRKEMEEAETERKRTENAMKRAVARNQQNVIDQNYTVNNTAGFYKKGGALYTSKHPIFKIEGGEAIFHPEDKTPVLGKNGKVKNFSNVLTGVYGPSHDSESGGINATLESPGFVFTQRYNVDSSFVNLLKSRGI